MSDTAPTIWGAAGGLAVVLIGKVMDFVTERRKGFDGVVQVRKEGELELMKSAFNAMIERTDAFEAKFAEKEEGWMKQIDSLKSQIHQMEMSHKDEITAFKESMFQKTIEFQNDQMAFLVESQAEKPKTKEGYPP